MDRVSHSTFRLRISPWRDRSCVRVIELRGDQTLGHVHRAIQDAFDLDDDHCWAFYLSGDFDDPETEYRGSPEGALTRWPARLDGLDLSVGMRIAYVFDFGDNLRHDIAVVAVGTCDPSRHYPHLVEQHGTPPPQYPWQAADGDGRAEADDAEPSPAEPDVPELLRQLHEPFAAAWDRCGESGIDPAALDADLGLAGRVLEACGDLAGLRRFESLGDESVEPWIADIRDALLSARRFDDALGLGRRFLAVTEVPQDRLDLAEVICTAGRAQDGLALLDEAAPSEPVEADRIAVARAKAMAQLGRLEEAEQTLRALLARRWLSGRVRRPAVGVLMQLLVRTGREAEAARLRAAEVDRHEQRTLPNPPVRRDGPKIGRNDPCPCGSGKKYKKCCGR